jgi:hypothetical protein
MSVRHRLTVARCGLALVLGAASWGPVVYAAPVMQVAQAPALALPDKLSDAEYWALIERLSEPGGNFQSDNLVSNEIYMQTIIPDLVTTTKPGRVYLGVGPEQNFTYIAALKPRMVFIIDVRRGNLHMHMLYKALFEMSKDRADFVARLFSKKRPDGLSTTSTAQDIFSALVGVETSEPLYKDNLAAVQALLTKTHGFPLSKDDLAGIEYIYSQFFWYGPSITYSSSTGGGGGRGNFVNYQSLMVADDGNAVKRSYLASEENFLFMKNLESKNLLVPVVGDFGGPKAIRAVGTYLKEREAVVSAFYLSNVEQYLERNGVWMSFCQNFARLPLDESSTFIFSAGPAGGGGRGGGGGLLSWYRPILADVKVNKCDVTPSLPAVR